MQSYTLPSSITIETIEALLGELKDVPLTGGGLAVDATQVEIITTPGVQVILALGKALAQAGGTFAILEKSAAFTQAFHTLGLDGQLKEWSN